MQSISHPLEQVHVQSSSAVSLYRRFINWCAAQEENRFMWLAGSLVLYGCVLSPITVFAVFLAGNSMLLWALTIGSMAVVLISHLAALPTRITIPIFFAGVLVNTAIILTGLINWLMSMNA